MEGEITVESEIDKGTVFSITLTFKKSLKVSLGNSLKYLKALKETHLLDQTTKLKILLAEDNFINQLLAQTILAQLDFEVTTVDNGKLALDAVLTGDFDIILMDLMMPEMTGFEATEAIRNLSNIEKSSIPIIALTADVSGDIKEKCEMSGFNDYISKPFEPNNLKNKIIELINLKKS